MTRVFPPEAIAAEQARLDAMGPWFGAYDFGNGLGTRSLRVLDPIDFERRAERIMAVLARFCDPAACSILDVACADGYFSYYAKKAGFRRVVGMDIRPESIERARYCNRFFNYSDIDFVVGNIYDVDVWFPEGFDVILAQGIFYHLANPILAYEKICAISRRMVYVGGRAIRSEAEPFYQLRAETTTDFIQGDQALCLYPSTRALFTPLFFFGYRTVLDIDCAHERHAQWGQEVELREFLALREPMRPDIGPPPPLPVNGSLRWQIRTADRLCTHADQTAAEVARLAALRSPTCPSRS